MEHGTSPLAINQSSTDIHFGVTEQKHAIQCIAKSIVVLSFQGQHPVYTMAKQLKGHTEDILCVTSIPDGKLLSGAEAGEMCFWDLTGGKPTKINTGSGDDVTSICCSKQRPHEVYVACGTSVLLYDTRQFSGPMHTLTFNEEEINQVVLHEKENYLAACDDSGQVKVFSVQDRRVFKTMKNGHENICSAVAFRPGKPWDLLSGGLDSKLIHWDFSKAKVLSSFNFEELEIQDDQADKYLVNPPFIHSLSVSTNGNFLACGTENALVQIFDCSKRKITHSKTLRNHRQGVSQVCFVPVKDDRELLLSAGNDGSVIFWDVQVDVAGAGGASASAERTTAAEAHANTNENKVAELVHGNKINWISSYSESDQHYVVVADNTNVLTTYQFPC